jgi:hypothetical protein
MGDCLAVMSSVCASYGAYWCDFANTYLKPKLAKATSDCMLANTATSCGPPSTCVRNVLATACPDPTAEADCVDYVNKCSATVPITYTGCRALIDGLNSAGRARVRACIDSDAGVCRYGVWACIEGV